MLTGYPRTGVFHAFILRQTFDTLTPLILASVRLVTNLTLYETRSLLK